MIEIEALVESIVYRNEENGYTVAKVRYDKKLVSIVGCIPFLNEGHKVRIQGEWTIHGTFGEQLKVDFCEEIVPSTTEGIEKYLASGLVIGIGPVTAKRIVEKFGIDTLDIMEMNPLRLMEIEGIGEKKASAIADNFKDQRELRQVMVFLQSYGITPGFAIKIYKKYGQDTVKTVKENPYKLCDDISGIGFKTSDKIARNLGVDLNSKYRIMAGIKYTLTGSTANGHIFLPKLLLYDECSKILNVDESLMEEALVSLVIARQLVVENIENDTAVYLNTLYYSELGVAKKLIELSIYGNTEVDESDEAQKIEEEINYFEENNKINFAEEQRRAIITGVQNSITVITGGPGTGKTTIIKCIINVFEKKGMNIVLGAPTGRAAKRITETTGYEAKTIHRLLEMGYAQGEGDTIFTKDESDPIETEVIIIDEASMIDILLMNGLMKALALGTKLIMVGDVDQLPSVGPGNVLRDIIDSGAVNVVMLNKIFRQSEQSLITLNAHKINNGEMPDLNDRDKDFFFINKSNGTDIIEEILKLVNQRLPSFKEGFDSMKDIQVLSPMRKGEVGINNLNTRLQQLLNPNSSQKAEKLFKESTLRVGDKVMQIKNNYRIEWKSTSGNPDLVGTGIFNGDIGYIESIDNEAQQVNIIFDDDRRVNYDFVNLDELELAYAVTIHKSQGSEFPIVVIPIWNGPPMLMTRNLIYTAVTRAKKLVVLVGSKQALFTMINNNTISERYTRLKSRIQSIMELIK